jgi:hypothetical protein
MTIRHWLLSLSVLAPLFACSGNTLDIGNPRDGGTSSQDSSDAGTGDAQGVGTSCDIDSITGTFAVSYTKLTGTCGEIQTQYFTWTQANVLWNDTSRGCTPKSKTTSSDRCSTTGSADCVVGEIQEHVEGTIKEQSPDLMSGTVSINATSPQGPCTGTYTITYTRQ